jgi:hypothetical protein
MARKALGVLVPMGLTLLVASQWTDIRRYFKIKRLSAGRGHPENVPAQGRKMYPQDPVRGAADGTGEFESASRGAPARAG